MDMFLLVGAVVLFVIAVLLWFGQVKAEDETDKELYMVFKWIAVALVFVAGVISAVTTVPSGSVKGLSTFGRVDVNDPPLSEGLHLKKPWQSTFLMSVRQQTFNRNAAKGNQMEVIVGDGVSLTADVSFHWILQPQAAAWVYQKFGEDYAERLQIPSAAGALRDVVGGMKEWTNVVRDKQMVEVETTKRLASVVREKLLAAGIPADVAQSAFVFPKVDIRRITPPKAIQTAIANKKAAEQDLERQKTEVAIAAMKAQKGVPEGQRIRNMVLAIFNDTNEDGQLPAEAKLPEGITAEGVSALITAIATKQNAQSVQTAAESGKVSTMLIPATSSIAVGAK